jgi:FSR family fosmidomycin resistance protein-like MFS transporter
VKVSSLRTFFGGMLPLFILAHFGHHLVSNMLAPLTPYIRDEFALNYTEVGWLSLSFTIAYGVSQLPTGWLADRFGARALLTVGVSGVALAGILVGLSPSYVAMVMFFILMGLLGGSYHLAAAPLISASVVPERRGRALGFHQIGGSVSYFLAPLIAAGIAGYVMGWRAPFIIVGAIMLAFGLAFYFLLGRRAKMAPEAAAPRAAKEEPAPRPKRETIAFLVLSAMGQTVAVALLAYVPVFAVDHFGVSNDTGAFLLAIVYAGGLTAPLGGFLADRWGAVRVLLAMSIAAVPMLWLLNVVSFGWGLYVVLFMIGVFTFITLPVSEVYLLARADPKRRSTMLGVYYMASRGGTGVLTLGAGYLIDRAGFTLTFNVLTIILLAFTLGGLAVLWRRRD